MPADLVSLLGRARPLLKDGATGTELSRRGVPTNLPLWSAHAFTRPEWTRILGEIHLDYARAGAEVLVTNTFRTTLRALSAAGHAREWRSFNQEAVSSARLAARSAPGPCLVAGAIAPLEDCYSPELVPPDSSCLSEHRRQVDLLGSLGVDLILIETMSCGREARAALVAARASGLDLLLALCPRAPAQLLSGEPLETLVGELVDAGGERLRGILINCASPEVLEKVFARFGSLCPWLPHGLYAHLGEPDPVTGWRLPDRHEPELYADWIGSRITEGARIVGGCCGTTPEHIRALARRLDT